MATALLPDGAVEIRYLGPLSRGQALKLLRDRAGFSQRELGAKVGLSGAQISRYENDEDPIPDERIPAMADALGVDERAFGGQGLVGSAPERFDVRNEMRQMWEALQRMEGIIADVARVPVLGSVPAGQPLPHINEVRRYEIVPTEDVEGIDNPVLVEVHGESMAPELHDGDMVLIDPDREPRPNNIVLVQMDGEVTLKRLVREEDGRALLVPTNRAFPIIEVKERQLLRRGVAVRWYKSGSLI